MTDIDEKLDRIAASFAKTEHLLYVTKTLPLQYIRERIYDRMCAGLTPYFKLHLWCDGYPEAAAFGMDKILGCDIVWH